MFGEVICDGSNLVLQLNISFIDSKNQILFVKQIFVASYF